MVNRWTAAPIAIMLLAIVGYPAPSRAAEEEATKESLPAEQSAPASGDRTPGSGRPPGMPGGGGGGPPGFGGPPGYDATWYPSRPVTGQSTDFGFVRQGVKIGAPIWKEGGDIVIANVSVRNTLFFTDAILPDTQRPFPEQLWDINLSMNYMHRFENGWSGGLTVGIGSPSDRPFASIDEINATLMGFLRVPARNERDAWTFGLLYMSGGAVDFPFPIIAYAWNHSERFNMNIGIPFSLMWKPADDLTVNLSYLPLMTINARLTWQADEKMQIFGGYQYLNETYFLADRTIRTDRYFVFEQRLITGVSYELTRNASAELNGGYSFGRYFGEGDSQWGALTDQVNVDPGAFVGLRVKLLF